MSKSNKKVVSTKTVVKTEPTVSRKRTPAPTPSSASNHPLIFNKTNYILMLAGIGLIALGLVLMAGGAMPSPDVWDDSIIYSARRTVLGPFVIIVGLVLEIYAIFKKADGNSDVEATA